MEEKDSDWAERFKASKKIWDFDMAISRCNSSTYIFYMGSWLRRVEKDEEYARFFHRVSTIVCLKTDSAPEYSSTWAVNAGRTI